MGHTLTMPSGWKYPKAREVFRSVTDKHHNGVLRVLSATQDRGIILRDELDKDIRYASENLSAYKKVSSGNFVIHLRSFQGGIAYSSIEGLISPAYIVLTPKVEICDDYYRYLFVSKDYIKGLMVAVYGIRDGKQISYDSFGMINIPLPPLPEQKRIAEILTEQDKLIALKERLIAAKKKQKKWLMQNLLTGKIRFEGFNDKWEKLRLGDVCKTFSGGTPLKDKAEYYNGKIKWIKSGELNSKRIYETAQTLTIEGFTNSSAKLVKPGTILLALYGATAGVCAITMVEACINQAVLAIIPQKKLENGFFLYLLTHLMHKAVKKYTQGGQPNFSAEIIKSLKLIVPSISEQTAIAERLTAADQEIELLTKELEAQKQVKKYLMQQLLTGKIRVTGGES